MKIALIMPPMDSGENNFSFFRVLHHFAKGKPHWLNTIRFAGKNSRSFIDYEDFPKGLILIGTMLKEEHTVKIFNFINSYNTWEEISDFCPDLIGITCSTGGNLRWIYNFILEIKKNLKSVVILGGPHITLDPFNALKTTQADFAFNGEAELVVRTAIKFIETGKNPPSEGFVYRNRNKIIVTPQALVNDLSLLPLPENNLVDLSRYQSIGIEASRGCRSSCDFCFLSGMSAKCGWRPRPLEHIIAELKILKNCCDLSNKKIYFIDLNFAVDEKRVITLCDQMTKAGIHSAKWACTDISVQRKTLDKMVEAGFKHLYVGVESGAKTFIRKYPKLKNKNSIVSFFKKAKEAGITPEADLVMLAPGETNFTILETLRLCRELYRLPGIKSADGSRSSFAVHLFRPYPNIKALKELHSKGVKLPENFNEWGAAFEKISRGDFSPLGSSIKINKFFLYYTLICIGFMNIKGYILPRFHDKLYLTFFEKSGLHFLQEKNKGKK